MSRMIVSKSDVASRGRGTIAESDRSVVPDKYPDRVAKYIPGEVVALYLALTGMAPSAPGGATPGMLWVCFAIGVIATPLYLLAIFRRERSKLKLRLKVTQIVVSTVAFVLWAWVLQDPKTAVVEPYWGRFCLPVFTFLVGLYEP